MLARNVPDIGVIGKNKRPNRKFKGLWANWKMDIGNICIPGEFLPSYISKKR
jgi:hypothetical protein